MDLLDNLENAVEETIEKNNEDINNLNEQIEDNALISEQEIELAEKLDAVEEFTIDRFEEDRVVLENRKTGEMIDVNKNELPDNLKEGIILKKINGKYFVDEELNQQVSERLEDKLKDFWN